MKKQTIVFLTLLVPLWLWAGPNEDLLKAASTGNVAGVKAALKAGANVNVRSQNKEGDTALIMAAENGHREIVKILIKAGADVNMKSLDEGDTALGAAQEKGYLAIAKILKEAGAR
ncbi:MAG: ankyrin repeat domain-containing protein [Leptospirales bacterium]|nr:ankyrin repeat domain-containing protein [Leptospirales bacterium]